MARITFASIIIIHGLIHLLGFIKAFGLMEVSQLSANISKPLGILWVLATILFLTSTVMYFTKTDSWPLVVVIAALLSQILIVTVWQDAKFGIIANILVVVMALPSWGSVRFDKRIMEEQKAFLQTISNANADALSSAEIETLPMAVQNWLSHSGAIGKPKSAFIRLRQSGKMKTKPDGSWMPFTAIQYVNPSDPSFIWQARVKMMPLIYLQGRDRLQDGVGEMQIRLLGGFDVVNESDNPKINSGAMIRYLGEMCWYPSAALNSNVEWEELTPLSTKATLHHAEREVSGVFSFNEDGSLKSFSADRYYGGDENANKQKWLVEVVENKEFNGYPLPSKCTVTWKLPEGDFTWLEMEIEDLQVNQFELY